MEAPYSKSPTTLPNLVSIGIVVVEMFLVPEVKDSRCSRFNPPLLFISKRHGLKLDGIFPILATRNKRREGQREKKLEWNLLPVKTSC